MVRTTLQAEGGWQVVIRPNRALGWRQTQWVFLGLLILPLGIAVTFSVAGFWPVLPFAGAELLALGAALYLNALGGTAQEVVSADAGTVAVARGDHAPREHWEFPRAWTRVRLLHSRLRWYPSQLVIGSGARGVELGRFLTEEERCALAASLARMLRPAVGAPGGRGPPAPGGSGHD